MKSSRNIRQALLLEIIKNQPIETQEALLSALEKRGIHVTQATISRDIKELGLLKIKGEDERYYYAQVDGQSPANIVDRMIRLLRNSVLSMDHVNNLLVLKTLSGSANAAAEAIDSLGDENILGTLAGDNTILIIMRNEAGLNTLVQRLQQLIS